MTGGWGPGFGPGFGGGSSGLPVFPTLRGQGINVTKTSMHSTRVAKHVSGREVRVPLYAQTIYQFELTFSVLASGSSFAYTAVGANTLEILMDFFNSLQGSFRTFLYTDPTDNFQTGVPLAPGGDGSNRSFDFQRALYNWFEPVGYVSYVAAVYWNGVAQVGNWTLANPTAAIPYPNLTFTSAPGSGVVVSADFNWQFVCRASEDDLGFEQFMGNLWSVKSWKFQSVRNGGF
jgi:hypothetical protein